MARLIIFEAVVLICLVSASMQKKAQDLLDEIYQSDIGQNNKQLKSRIIYDYQTRIVAYKDLALEPKCLLEFLKNDESIISQNFLNQRQNKLPKKFFISEKYLSKQQIWNLAGRRILEFCKGFPTFLIQDMRPDDPLNDITDDNNNSNRGIVKRSTKHYFVGKVRGQTQSQYLNFGNNNEPGKAEAESTYGGSKAVVSGTNGMGQAQSQSSSLDCDECYGRGHASGSGNDQEQIPQFGQQPIDIDRSREPYQQSGSGVTGLNRGTSGQVAGPLQPGIEYPGQIISGLSGQPGRSPGQQVGQYPGQHTGGTSQNGQAVHTQSGGPTGQIGGGIGQNSIAPGQLGRGAQQFGTTPGTASGIQGQTGGLHGQNGAIPTQLGGSTGQFNPLTGSVGRIPEQGSVNYPTDSTGSRYGPPTSIGQQPTSLTSPGGQLQQPSYSGISGGSAQQPSYSGSPGGAPQQLFYPGSSGTAAQPPTYSGGPIGPAHQPTLSGRPLGPAQQPTYSGSLGGPVQQPTYSGTQIGPAQDTQTRYQTGIKRPVYEGTGQPIPPGYNTGLQQTSYPSYPGVSTPTGHQIPGTQVPGYAGQQSPGYTQQGQIPNYSGQNVVGYPPYVGQPVSAQPSQQGQDYSKPQAPSHGPGYSGQQINNYPQAQIPPIGSSDYQSTGSDGSRIPQVPGSQIGQITDQASQGHEQSGKFSGRIQGDYGSNIGQAGKFSGIFSGQYEHNGKSESLLQTGQPTTISRPGQVAGVIPGQTSITGFPGSPTSGVQPGQVWEDPGTSIGHNGQINRFPSQSNIVTGQIGGLPSQIPTGILPGGILDPAIQASGQVPGINKQNVGQQSGGNSVLGNVPGYPGQIQGTPGQVTRFPGQLNGETSQPGSYPAHTWNGIPGQTTGIPGQIGGIPGYVSGVPGQVGGIPGYVSGVPGQVAGIPGYVSGVPGKVGGIPGYVSGVPGQLHSQHYGHPGQINGIPGQVTGISGQVSGTRPQIGGSTGQVSGLPEQTSGIPGQIVYPGYTGGIPKLPGQGTRAPEQGIPGYANQIPSQYGGTPGQITGYPGPINKIPGQVTGLPGQVSGGTTGQVGVFQEQIMDIPGQQPGQSAQLPNGKYDQYGRYIPPSLSGQTPEQQIDDDSDSQVQTSVQQTGNNETQASANAQGKYLGGTAQSQVSGTYSGSGSFSASAGSDDGKRGAMTQVSGGKEGALSAAQGRGGLGQSQAQVQLSSATGDTTSNAQSGGWNHGTQTQVQASGKGGMADAQANGPGSTSSQAQIGFTPYDENDPDDQESPFRGGGTASAQGGRLSGQTQSQIQGNFRYGIKYVGAAQAGSGTQSNIAAARNQSRPFGLSGTFPTFKPLTFASRQDDNNSNNMQGKRAQVSRQVVSKTPDPQPAKAIAADINTTTHHSKSSSDQDQDQDYEDYEDDFEDNEEAPDQTKTKNIISQNSRTQKQHIVVDPLEDLVATVHQSKGDFPSEGSVLQPGQYIPGSPGYQIPQGFRGRVTSLANGPNTYAAGKHSQAQSVTLTPGMGRIIYKNPPIYAVSSKTHFRDGQVGFGSGYTYQPTQYQVKSGKSLPNFVSRTKSETGSRNPYTGKKTPAVFYSQSSSCGIFTNSCVFNGSGKICIPKPKINPDGTLVGC